MSTLQPNELIHRYFNAETQETIEVPFSEEEITEFLKNEEIRKISIAAEAEALAAEEAAKQQAFNDAVAQAVAAVLAAQTPTEVTN